jgi:hypothetical protein
VSNTSITYLIAAVVGVACISLWAWLILAPAWSSFSRVWERMLAAVMSVYVLAAMVALGGGVAAAVLYYYDEISI